VVTFRIVVALRPSFQVTDLLPLASADLSLLKQPCNLILSNITRRFRPYCRHRNLSCLSKRTLWPHEYCAIKKEKVSVQTLIATVSLITSGEDQRYKTLPPGPAVRLELVFKQAPDGLVLRKKTLQAENERIQTHRNDELFSYKAYESSCQLQMVLGWGL